MISPARTRQTSVPADVRGEVVLLRDDAEVASWPLLVGHGVDLSVVDQLVRWQLEFRRRGCSIRLRHACPHVVELLDLAGVAEVVPAMALRQVGREAEGGEQPGVEEVVVPDDPIA